LGDSGKATTQNGKTTRRCTWPHNSIWSKSVYITTRWQWV